MHQKSGLKYMISNIKTVVKEHKELAEVFETPKIEIMSSKSLKDSEPKKAERDQDTARQSDQGTSR